MANKTASPWLIPYPEETDKPKVYPALAQEQSERIAKIMKERFVTITEHGASFAAASGELVKCTAAITVTLPAAAVNATVGVLANNHVVEVTAGAAKIYGDFVEGKSAIKLVGYSHIVLQSDGTNWFITDGTPKNENKYVKTIGTAPEKAANGVEYECSATRPVFVVADFYSSGAYASGSVTVGGVQVTSTKATVKEAGTSEVSATWIVPPGAKFKVEFTEHAEMRYLEM